MVFDNVMDSYHILKEIKLFARRACSFFLLRACRGEARQTEDGSSKKKILSAHICVRLRLNESINLCLLWLIEANLYTDIT